MVSIPTVVVWWHMHRHLHRHMHMHMHMHMHLHTRTCRWIILQREKKERERREMVRNLENKVASLQNDVAFWQTKSEDADAG